MGFSGDQPCQAFDLLVFNRFEIVHVDIVSPLPPASNFNSSYAIDARDLVTIINRAEKLCEVLPFQNFGSETIAKAFFHQWVSRFDVSWFLVSDRAGSLNQNCFISFPKLLGFIILVQHLFHP